MEMINDINGATTTTKKNKYACKWKAYSIKSSVNAYMMFTFTIRKQ